MKIRLSLIAEELAAAHGDCVSAVRGGESFDIGKVHVLLPGEVPDDPECLYFAAPRALPPTGDFCFCFTEEPPDGFPHCIVLRSSLRDAAVNVYQILLRLLHWQVRILRISSETTDLQEFLDISAPILGCALVLDSLPHNHTFISNFRYQRENNWAQIKAGYFSPTKQMPPSFWEAMHLKSGPFWFTLPSGSSECIQCNVMMDSVRVASICAIGLCGTLQHRHEIYLHELRLCAEQILRRLLPVHENPLAAVFTQLLCGQQYELEALECACAKIGWAVQGHTYSVCVIRPMGNREREFRAEQYFYRNMVAEIYPNSIALAFDNSVVLIRNYTAIGEDEYTEAEKRFSKFLRQIGAAAGNSFPFSQLTDMVFFYHQAKAVADGVSKPNGQGEYEHYMVYDLISSFSSTHPLRMYTHPDVHRLAELDRSTNMDLLLSLYYYLLNDRSHKVCAEKLYIHRNSFAYRIKKITESLTCDLNDESTRISILLSICMYWYCHPSEDPIGISAWTHDIAASKQN